MSERDHENSVRILITGFPCEYVSDLGGALGQALTAPTMNVDSAYWEKKRWYHFGRRKATPKTRELIVWASERIPGAFVAYGSILGWGLAVEESFDLMVMVAPKNRESITAPSFALSDKEAEEVNGILRNDPGHRINGEVASLELHHEWFDAQTCRKLNLIGDDSIEVNVQKIEAEVRRNWPGVLKSPRIETERDEDS